MRHLAVGRTVAAPAERVWSLLAEFDSWPEWGTSIRAVESDADRVAEGVRGRVQTVGGIWLPFRITTVDEGRAWEWDVLRMPATGHRVTTLDATACRVEFSTPWITAPYLVVLRRALTQVQRIAEQP